MIALIACLIANIAFIVASFFVPIRGVSLNFFAVGVGSCVLFTVILLGR